MIIRKMALFLVAASPVILLAATSSRDLPAHPADAAAPATITPPGVSRVIDGRALYRSDALAVPTVLEVVGDRLILADTDGDRSLRVLRRSDGEPERSFGRKGRGPREFESVFSIDVIDAAGRVMVHDPALQRVTWIDLDRDFDGDRWVSDRSVKLTANAMVLVAGWTPEGILGIGSFTDGRLAHLSPTGRLLQMSGAPPAEPGKVTRAAWSRAYQGRLAHRPDRSRWAVVSRFADRVDIFDRSGRLVADGDRPYGFDPEDLRTEDPEAVRFGYIDVTATPSRIYALFSGRIRAEGEAHLGDRIHVFDWDGRLVESLALDSRLMAIAVAPDGDRLYGIRHDPVPAVMEYRLD